MNGPALRVLVVDDEQPAVDELTWLLQRDPRIGEVLSCTAATEALRILQESELDALFLDISMPGLSGLELAQVLSRFKQPPRIVFVTAHEQHAVEAFELQAVDYVLKPVRAERLSEAVRRIGGGTERPAAGKDVQIPVELGGVTRFVQRSDITHVEAQGDYARLHTATGSHLGVAQRGLPAHPPLAARRAPPRGGGADGVGPLLGRRRRGRRAGGQSPAHPRAARPAAEARAVAGGHQ